MSDDDVLSALRAVSDAQHDLVAAPNRRDVFSTSAQRQNGLAKLQRLVTIMESEGLGGSTPVGSFAKGRIFNGGRRREQRHAPARSGRVPCRDLVFWEGPVRNRRPQPGC
jgi:hypothetical protein